MKIPILREIELFFRAWRHGKYKNYKITNVRKLNLADLGYYSMNFGPAIEQKHLENCKMYGDRALPLELVPKGCVSAEVGVAYGEYTDKILEIVNPREHYMIDIYELEDFWNDTRMRNAGLNHYEWIQNKYKNDNRVKLRKGLSYEVLEQFPDDFFDYIYLDGAHEYEIVKQDIEVSLKKIKNGGIIAFNDYSWLSPEISFEYGVERAVNEMLYNSNHEVIAYAMRPSRMDDMVIRIHK